MKKKFLKHRILRKNSILNKSKLNRYKKNYDKNLNLIKYVNFESIQKQNSFLSIVINYVKNISIIIGALSTSMYIISNNIKSPQLYLDYCVDGNYVAEFTAEDLEDQLSSTAILNERDLYYDNKSHQMYYHDSKYNIDEGSSINYADYYESTHEKIQNDDGSVAYTRTELIYGDYKKIDKKPYMTLVSDPVSYIIKSDTDISKINDNELAYRPNKGSSIVFQLRNENKWNSMVAKDVKINIKLNSIELDLRNENIVEIDGKKYFDDKWLIKDNSTLEYTFTNDIIPMNEYVDNNIYETKYRTKYKNDYSSDYNSSLRPGDNTRMYKYNEKISLDLSQSTGIISSSNISTPTIDVTIIYGNKTKSYSIDIEYESCPCYYKNSTCNDPVIEKKSSINRSKYYDGMTYENLTDGSENIFIADMYDNPLCEIIDEYINFLNKYNKDNEELLHEYNTESKRKSQEYIKEKRKIENDIKDKHNDLEKKTANIYYYYMIKGIISLNYDKINDEEVYNKLITVLESEKDTIVETFVENPKEALIYLIRKSGYTEENIMK